MPGLFTEDTYEQAIIELFENMGYDHIYAPDFDRDYTSPLMDSVLRDSLVRVNRGLPVDAIEEAINKLRTFDTGSLLQKNMDRGDAVLTDEQIDDMGRIGKIAFGIVYGEKKPDVDEAVKTAIQGFEDGLFRVFRGMDELTELDREEKFNEGDEITFIRLTMLAGRMW